jgi:DNA-binding GntR family transcriptional regulator
MATKIKVSPLRGSLSEQAYQAVRRMILRGELPPGAAVARRPLAQKLGVSFLPVSEALQRLEHEGLVESWPRVGTRVKIPTVQDVRGNYVIREALESQSARLFAEKASAAERAEMLKMAVQVDAMQADPKVDFFDFFALHERFHRRLAECAGCPALVEAIEKTNTLIRTWQYAAISDYREMPARYHEVLVEALARGEVEAADRAMRDHVRNGMDEVLHRMEPYFHGDFPNSGAPVRSRAAVRGRR